MKLYNLFFLSILITLTFFIFPINVNASTKNGIVTASNLYLRTGPSRRYRPVSKLKLMPRGTKVTLIQRKGRWGKVSVNGKGVSGYCHLGYVRFSGSDSNSNSDKPTLTGGSYGDSNSGSGSNSGPSYVPKMPSENTIRIIVNKEIFDFAIASYPAKKGSSLKIKVEVKSVSNLSLTCPSKLKFGTIKYDKLKKKDMTSDNRKLTLDGSSGSIEFNMNTPNSEGIYQIRIAGNQGGKKFDGAINIMALHPFSSGYIKISGYRIGRYPSGVVVPGFVKVANNKEFNMFLTPHIKVREFACKQRANFPKYFVVSPRELQKLELIRSKIGAIQFTSGYRTPIYNAGCGGAKKSYHMRGIAYDFVPSKVSLSKGWSTVNQIDSQYKKYLGGGKKYSSFIHTDVRGFRSRW